MIFYTNFKEPRPIRLSEETRKFAYESLNARYGKETWENQSVILDKTVDFAHITRLEQYNQAIYEIAKCCPLRICEGELISGAATLGLAISHMVPATFEDKAVFRSVSHLTPDFGRVVRLGTDAIKRQVRRAMHKHSADNDLRGKALMESMLMCLNYMDLWRKRYIKALEDMYGYENNIKNLRKVPAQPAESFYEAVQSLWLLFAFQRLCGNWPGIGRIDDILGEYLEKDLKDGKITLDEAREILAHFFIKGCEWVRGADDRGNGDAQHFANIVLGGVDERGRELTNEVTYLVLDIIEELGISEFPVSVRINKNSDEKLLRRVAEVMRHGGGVIAVYNEDLVLESMTDYGYEPREARSFTNDGCWEVQVPGRTYFTYYAFDALKIFQQVTLNEYKNVEFSSADELYDCFVRDLKEYLEAVFSDNSSEWRYRAFLYERRFTPCTVVSMFYDDCIQSGRSYFDQGTKYNVCSPHIGGLPDVANSIYAIKKLVFDEKKVSFAELMDILKNDWEGHEDLRQYVKTHYEYFGNDNDEVDKIASDIVADFADICECFDCRWDILTPGGISTFTREVEWLPHRLSTASGHKKGDVLAPNMSPTPGDELKGATAVIKSYCKADLKRMQTGAALDLKLFPTSVYGEDGIDAIISLIRGFLELGGYFMQIDVVDNEMLKKAQKNPEKYATMSVRVSGWNARFVTLTKEYQDMLIQRTATE